MNNISQVIVFVNTHSNIFLIKYLTTYINSDILEVCINRRRMYGYFTVCDVDMNGFLVTPIRNHVCAPTRNVTALIGKNPVRRSKRE